MNTPRQAAAAVISPPFLGVNLCQPMQQPDQVLLGVPDGRVPAGPLPLVRGLSSRPAEWQVSPAT